MKDNLHLFNSEGEAIKFIQDSVAPKFPEGGLELNDDNELAPSYQQEFYDLLEMSESKPDEFKKLLVSVSTTRVERFAAFLIEIAGYY